MQSAVSRSLRIAVLTCGAVQVAVGILLFLSDIGGFIFDEPRCYYSHTVAGSGIWAGLLFIITGIHGILAGQRYSPEQIPKHRLCRLVTCLTLSILGFMISITMAVFSAMFSGDYHYYRTIDRTPITDPRNTGYVQYGSVTSHEYQNPCPSDAGRQLPRAHAVAFFFMLCVNFAQLVITSVSIHKVRPSPPVTRSNTVFTQVPLTPRVPHMDDPPMYTYPRQPVFEKA